MNVGGDEAIRFNDEVSDIYILLYGYSFLSDLSYLTLFILGGTEAQSVGLLLLYIYKRSVILFIVNTNLFNLIKIFNINLKEKFLFFFSCIKMFYLFYYSSFSFGGLFLQESRQHQSLIYQ